MATPYDDSIDDGVEYLDYKLGDDWPQRIDVDRLDLASGCNCVLGQLVGGFSHGSSYRTWVEGGLVGVGDTSLTTRESEALGFTLLNRGQPSADWSALTAAWRERIIALQTERNLMTDTSTRTISRRLSGVTLPTKADLLDFLHTNDIPSDAKVDVAETSGSGKPGSPTSSVMIVATWETP